MDMYKKVIVALALNEKRDKILLEKVSSLFKKSTEMHFIHVTEHMMSYEVSFGMWAGLDTEELLRKEGSAYMEQLVRPLGFTGNTQKILIGPTTESVVEYTKQNGGELLVMGRHERHGLKLLLGSTAGGLLHHAPCDILALDLDCK